MSGASGAPGSNRHVVLTRRPDGPLTGAEFEIRNSPIPTCGPDDVLVRVEWLSIEPAQRMFLEEDNAVGLSCSVGEVVWGFGLGTVIESRQFRFGPGDQVQGWFGWQEIACGAAHGPSPHIGRVPDGADAATALALGTTALTGFVGMVEIAKPQTSETVVVTAAAGATGSVAAQLAVLAGSRVIGIAGGAAKCHWLTDTLGLHAALDRTEADLPARLREVAPDGVDLCFDCVGGAVLDSVLVNLAPKARIVTCGAVSTGYGAHRGEGSAVHHYDAIAAKRATVQGFMVGDHAHLFRDALAELRSLSHSGRLVVAIDVADGLERAPAALAGLFTGRNHGKQLVRI